VPVLPAQLLAVVGSTDEASGALEVRVTVALPSPTWSLLCAAVPGQPVEALVAGRGLCTAVHGSRGVVGPAVVPAAPEAALAILVLVTVPFPGAAFL